MSVSFSANQNFNGPAGGRRSDRLLDKVTLIIEGASRRGQRLALDLARAGSHIVLVYWNGSDQIASRIEARVEELGRRCLAFSGDPRDPGFVTDAVDEISSEFGRLDVYIDLTSADDDSQSDSNENGDLRSTVFPRLQMLKAAVGEIDPKDK